MPATPEEIELVLGMMANPGFTVLEKWLKEAIEKARDRCQFVDADHRYYQGLAQGLAEFDKLFKKCKDYKDSPKGENKVGWGAKPYSATVPPAGY